MSERRERLGRVLFAEGVQMGRDEGSFAPGDEPTWDSIGAVQRMFCERKAEAVATAVDEEYAPLLKAVAYLHDLLQGDESINDALYDVDDAYKAFVSARLRA